MSQGAKTAFIVGGGALAVLFFLSRSSSVSTSGFFGTANNPQMTVNPNPNLFNTATAIGIASQVPSLITSFKNIFTSGGSVSNPNDSNNSADLVGSQGDPAYDSTTGTWDY